MSLSGWIKPAGVFLVLAAAGLTGCSAERDPSEVLGPSEAGEVVVDAVLMVGRSFPDILVTRTTDPAHPWNARSAALVGATVLVFENGNVHTFAHDPQHPGRYVTLSPHVILPHTEYRLSVLTPGQEEISAVTVTPPKFDLEGSVLLAADGETVLQELEPFGGVADPYESNRLVHGVGLVEALVEENPEANYQVGIFSLDEGSDFVIDVSFLDEDDLDLFKRATSSPALTDTDGALRLPWAAVVFEGRHLIRVFAIDLNWFDLLRSFPEFGGGAGFGGNTGDDFEKPIFRVNGGIGLFGSGSADSLGITVLPKDVE